MMTTQSLASDSSQGTSLEEFFEFEFNAEGRHEFIDGKIMAMSYTSEEHGTIVINLNRLLGNCLLDQDCSVYASDRMLFVPGCGQVFYPDLLIVCGKHEFYQASENMKATLNPTVVIEVLSNSKEYLDKTHKTRCFKQIPSLRQMIFVSQREMHIRILEREGEKWMDTEFYEEGDVLHIGDCEIPIRDIYRRVSW